MPIPYCEKGIDKSNLVDLLRCTGKLLHIIGLQFLIQKINIWIENFKYQKSAKFLKYNKKSTITSKLALQDFVVFTIIKVQ